MINRVELIGSLVRISDLTASSGGTWRIQFTLAVPEVVYRNSQEQIETNWISCQLWGEQAATLSESGPIPGDKLYVVGSLVQSVAPDDAGKEEKKTRVRVYSVVELNPRRNRLPADDIPPLEPL